MRRRPVSLSSSYLTLEPAGISTTTMNRAGRCSPGTTSCQGCAMGSLRDNAESRPHWDVITCAEASPPGNRGTKLHQRQCGDNMRGVSDRKLVPADYHPSEESRAVSET